MNTRNTLLSMTVLAALTSLGSTSATADETASQNHFNSRLMIGSVNLESDWGVHDEQKVIGFINDYRRTNWPLAIALDLFGAGNEDDSTGTKTEAYTSAIHVGGRWQWQPEDHWFQPYVGAGLAFTYGELKPAKRDNDDTGYWLGVGADFALAQRLTLGADLRYSHSQIELAGRELNPGGIQFGLSLGYRW